jgi:6-phosphofructokinase 2
MAGRILTLTLNPTLDLATAVDAVVAGPKLRCDAPEIDPGGGGLNVSRAIHILGGSSTAFVVSGGPTGAMMERLLRAEGIEPVVLHGPGATRESLSVTDRSTGAQYRFVLPGPDWRARDADAALKAATDAAQPGDLVVLSGSQPPGVAPGFPLALARRLARKGAHFALDTSGPALLGAVASPGRRPIHVLRMDDDEAEELAGHPLRSAADSAEFAASLVHRGVAEIAIVARGADGSVLATADLRLHATPPGMKVVSKVGAGDSFTGAFVLSLSRGLPLPQALQTAVAAAASAVTTGATNLCERAQVRRLVPMCRVRSL